MGRAFVPAEVLALLASSRYDNCLVVGAGYRRPWRLARMAEEYPGHDLRFLRAELRGRRALARAQRVFVLGQKRGVVLTINRRPPSDQRSPPSCQHRNSLGAEIALFTGDWLRFCLEV